MVFKVCFRAWRKCCNSRDADKSKNKKYAHRPPRHVAPEESSTPQVYTTQKPLYESFRSFSEIEDEEIILVLVVLGVVLVDCFAQDFFA